MSISRYILSFNIYGYFFGILCLVNILGEERHREEGAISLAKFSSMMDSESSKEFDLIQPEDAWNNMIEYEWSRAELREEKFDGVKKRYPFISCYHDKDLSGKELKGKLIDSGINEECILLFWKKEEEFCFFVYASASWVKEKTSLLGLMTIPMAYSMKILSQSFDEVHKHLADVSLTDGSKIESIYVDVVLSPGAYMNLKNDCKQRILKDSNITDENNATLVSDGNNATLTSEYLRVQVLEYVNKSLREELFWSQQTAENKSINGKYWDELLSNKDNVPIEGNSSIICNQEYENLIFSLDEFSSAEKVTLNLMTVDFTDLLSKLLKTTTYTTLEESIVINEAKNCILKLILSLSLMPETFLIQTRPSFRVQNQNAQWLVQTGIKNEVPWYDVGLNGNGEVIAVSDTGLDTDHCYFEDNSGSYLVYGGPSTLNMEKRKVVQYDDFADGTDYNHGHGTHVCGSILGNNIDSSGIAKGIAFDAKIAFIDVGHEDGSLEIPRINRLLNTGMPYAKIHSASWGSSYAGYGVTAWSIDTFLQNNDELLVNVAAGNSGSGDTAYTVGDPSTAKNVIAVGASHSYGSDLQRGQLGPSYVADFSSRGPTLDGRTKPDILAPGKWISSANAIIDEVGECDPSDGKPPGPNNAKAGLISMQGTSMATPIVSGVAALIRQYLREGFYPSGEPNANDVILNPSAALIKAIILNGAQYMAGVDNGVRQGVSKVSPYDNTQNFGRVSLVDSLYIKNKSNVQSFLKDRQKILDGETITFTLTIDTSGGCSNSDFSVTLVWSDLPGLPGCTSCLYNDLDLQVQRNSKNYFPNGLTTKDSKNNAERVRISDAQNGDTFSIFVKAAYVETEQDFSLVSTGCFSGSGNTMSMESSEYNENDTSGEARKWSYLAILFVVPVVICIVYAIISKMKTSTTKA